MGELPAPKSLSSTIAIIPDAVQAPLKTPPPERVFPSPFRPIYQPFEDTATPPPVQVSNRMPTPVADNPVQAQPTVPVQMPTVVPAMPKQKTIKVVTDTQVQAQPAVPVQAPTVVPVPPKRQTIAIVTDTPAQAQPAVPVQAPTVAPVASKRQTIAIVTDTPAQAQPSAPVQTPTVVPAAPKQQTIAIVTDTPVQAQPAVPVQKPTMVTVAPQQQTIAVMTDTPVQAQPAAPVQMPTVVPAAPKPAANAVVTDTPVPAQPAAPVQVPTEVTATIQPQTIAVVTDTPVSAQPAVPAQTPTIVTAAPKQQTIAVVTDTSIQAQPSVPVQTPTVAPATPKPQTIAIVTDAPVQAQPATPVQTPTVVPAVPKQQTIAVVADTPVPAQPAVPVQAPTEGNAIPPLTADTATGTVNVERVSTSTIKQVIEPANRQVPETIPTQDGPRETQPVQTTEMPVLPTKPDAGVQAEESLDIPTDRMVHARNPVLASPSVSDGEISRVTDREGIGKSSPAAAVPFTQYTETKSVTNQSDRPLRTAQAERATVSEKRDLPGPDERIPKAVPEKILQPQALPIQPAPETGIVSSALPSEAIAQTERAAASSRTRELVEAIEAVSERILVTPGLMRGEGEIRIFLKSEILEGSEVRILASGDTLTVSFLPTVPDIAQLIELNRPQLEARLAERIQSFHIAVLVKKGNRNETV